MTTHDRLTYRVTSTVRMDPAERYASFFLRICQHGQCASPAWFIQKAHREDTGAEAMRVVCPGHSTSKSWRI